MASMNIDFEMSFRDSLKRSCSEMHVSHKSFLMRSESSRAAVNRPYWISETKLHVE